MSFRFALLATAVALAACGASAAGSSSAAGPVCGPASAHTLAMSRQARVYSSGGSAFACSVGKASIRLGSRQSCIGTPLIGPVTVTGALAAYGSETCGVDTGSTLVIVRRLTDGHELCGVPATGPGGPESYQAVESVVLKGDGAVAWIGTGHSLGARHRLTDVWRADRHGTTRLDSGLAIQVHSLRLKGSTVRWRNGAETRSAALR
jgi:hypothetical protein